MSLSIGIPSYNEGMNIIRLLKQIKLEMDVFKLDILEVIISDDSDDDTPTLVKQHLRRIRYPFDVRYIHHDNRRGVAAAWNEIFREARGDIIILYDADIILGRNTTYNLVRKLMSSKEYGVVGGRTESLLMRGLASEASYIISRWLHEVRSRYPESQFTIMGRALAIKRRLAREIYIPRQVIAVDLYLQCIIYKMGYKIGYAEDAEIFFKPPSKIREMMSQIIRAVVGHSQISRLTEKYIWSRLDTWEQIRIFLSLAGKTRMRYIVSTVIAYLTGLTQIPIVWRGATRYLWEVASTTKANR